METDTTLHKEKGKSGFRKAVGSMVCGAISFLLFFNVILSAPLAVTAIILGFTAKDEMRKLAKSKGKIFASFGICLGILVLILVGLQLLAYIQHA
ncbi:DUF4190 domain-containing protein [Planctomycetota bacterium]